MPRFLPTLLATLLTAFLFAMGVLRSRELKDYPDFDFVGPGEFHFQAAAGTDYTLWYKSTASIDGVYLIKDSRLPVGTSISVEHNGQKIPTIVNGSNQVEGSEGDRHSVLVFKTTSAGDYLVKTSGLGDQRAFRISQGYGFRELSGIFLWFLAAMVSTVLVFVFIILAATKRFPKPAAPARG